MKAKAFIYIILAGLTWGTTGIFVNFLAPYGFGTPQITFVRGTVAFLCMLVFLLIKQKDLLRTDRKSFFLMACNWLLCCATSIFYFLSLLRTSNATGVVLMYTAPVYVMLFSVFVWKERFSSLKLASIISMLVGCVLVAGVVGGFKVDALGLFFGVLSGITYASYNVLTKHIMRRGANPMGASTYTFLFMGIGAALICRPWQMPALIAKDPLVTILLLVGIGFVGCTLPYLFYTLAMRDLPAGTAASLGIIEPMAATVFAALILGQIPDPFQIVGIVLILASVVLLGVAENKLHHQKETEDARRTVE